MKSPLLGLWDWRAQSPVSSVSGWSHDVHWNDIEVSNGNYVWTTIDSEVSTAQAAGTPLRLRLFAGPFTPTFHLDDGGTHTSVTDPNFGITKQIPRWWETGMRAPWLAFITALSNAYDVNSQIGEVTTGLCATGYPEIGLRSIANPAQNRTNLLAAGYDATTKDVPAIKWEIDQFASLFPNTSVSSEFLVYQRLNADGTWNASDTPTTNTLIDYFIAALGSRGVLANDSLMWPTSPRKSGAGYQALYAKYTGTGSRIFLQTARDVAMTAAGATHQNCLDTIQYAINIGAAACEPWESYDNAAAGVLYLTAAERQNFDALLKSNSSPTVGDLQGGSGFHL